MAYFSTTAIMPSSPQGSGGGSAANGPSRPVPDDGRVYLEVGGSVGTIGLMSDVLFSLNQLTKPILQMLLLPLLLLMMVIMMMPSAAAGALKRCQLLLFLCENHDVSSASICDGRRSRSRSGTPGSPGRRAGGSTSSSPCTRPAGRRTRWLRRSVSAFTSGALGKNGSVCVCARTRIS